MFRKVGIFLAVVVAPSFGLESQLSQAQNDAISKHFEGALTGGLTEMIVTRTMTEKLKVKKENVIFTQSSCPDELNHDHFGEDISLLLANRWGEVFHLGGLAGVPFTGATGWGAFSHHVPDGTDGGDILVLFAPHVGITTAGTVGKVHRKGQDAETSACGAAVGAYNVLKGDDTSGRHLKVAESELDYQQNFIKAKLAPYIDMLKSITDENARQAQLARNTFTIVKDELENVMDMSWMGDKSQLILLGGIMLNLDGDYASDMFLPLVFESRKKDGSVTDLMAQFKSLDVSGVKSNLEPVQHSPNMKLDWTKNHPKEQLDVIKKHFPKAHPGSYAEDHVFAVLTRLGIRKYNTLLAQSSCPDELNHDDHNEDIMPLLHNRYGESFHLGGLAGVPFTGLTGWGAFSHHAHIDGNIIVLFAPHVGITDKGEVGKVHRPGQAESTTACGASIGAYNFLKKEKADGSSHGRLLKGAKKEGKHDSQQEYIINALRSRLNAIEAQPDENARQTKLAFETYKIVQEFLESILDTSWMGENSKLVLLGGIMMNIDGQAADLFLPLTFEARMKDGTVMNLMEEAFGDGLTSKERVQQVANKELAQEVKDLTFQVKELKQQLMISRMNTMAAMKATQEAKWTNNQDVKEKVFTPQQPAYYDNSDKLWKKRAGRKRASRMWYRNRD